MNRRDRVRETRRRLLVGAAELFDTHGYHGVAIADVIQLSGLPETSVYFHFPTLEAVGVALVGLQNEQWQQFIDDAGRRHETGKVSALEVVVAVSFAVARRLRDDVVSRAGVRLVQEGGPADTALPDPLAAWTAQTASLLAAARRDGAVTVDVDPQAAARALVGACYGVGYLSAGRRQAAESGALPPADAPAGEDVERRLSDLWRLLLGGLCPAGTDIGGLLARGHRLAGEL